MNSLTIVLCSLLICNMLSYGSTNKQVMDTKFLNETIQIYRTEIIPSQTQRVLSSIRQRCSKVINKRFNKCFKQFEEDSKNIVDKSLQRQSNEHENRWMFCCTIYNHYQCLKRSIERAAFYSMVVCDQNDVIVAEDIWSLQKHSKNTNGICPNEHVEYTLCVEGQLSIFGSNILISMVMVFGFIAVIISVLLVCFIIWRARSIQQKQRSMLKFQLLEPMQMEMHSTYE